MKDFNERVAAITGAASGIGRALAVRLAEDGCDLALSDVDEAGLEETVALCAEHPVKVTQTRVDVADRAAVHAWADEVVAAHGKVDLVINNAGVALAYTVESMSYEDFEWLMGINFWGVVYGTKAFLPHLKANGEGHIVNVSSVFGLVGVPTQSAYNAAKFAVRGFTDALRLELETEGSPVSCTTVHPGGVKTNIARSARLDPGAAQAIPGDDPAAAFNLIARTTPERAAATILDAVKHDRRRVVVGLDGMLFDLISRLPAVTYHGPVTLAARLQRELSKLFG
ncbi:MAG: SDR family NAD(P)-dependent oxidoreductase [Acidimicrobiia bacterium]|nr:SDR family NAD(P)-dependent oxidoreductase [Acidimicrobiia bacterium]